MNSSIFHAAPGQANIPRFQNAASTLMPVELKAFQIPDNRFWTRMISDLAFEMKLIYIPNAW